MIRIVEVVSAAMLSVAASSGGAGGAGPFGLDMGTPLNRLAVVKKLPGVDRYEVTAPRPEAEFTEYIAHVSPKSGVCEVSGLGRTHEGDPTGASIKAAFAGVASSLSARYGKSRLFDFAHDSDAPAGQWASSLSKKTRTLSRYWTPADGSSLPREVHGLMLEANALNPTGTWLMVKYQYKNWRDCEGESPGGK